MRTREQLEGVFCVGLCLFLLVAFTWVSFVAFGVATWATWTSALGVGTLAFGLPFGLLAYGKVRIVLGLLEGELYRSTGLALDLDMDGRMGKAELADNDEVATALAALRETPKTTMRVIPVHNVNDDIPVLQLPDGRELDANKLKDFVVVAQVTGVSFKAWKAKGWTRKEWETARDLLSLHGLATARKEGESGALTVSPGKCLRAFGL